jgi:DNA-binding CsgD family transcriptional regulator
MVRLRSRELRNALSFVHLASSADGPGPFPEPVVDLLTQLVPGEFAGYYEWNLPYEQCLAVELPFPTPRDVADARARHCSRYPLSNLLFSSEARALKLSDFVSARELHRLDYFDLVLRPFGIEHQIRLWLAAPQGRSHVFYLSRRRSDGDFGERDRTLLELLRPFLNALHERSQLRGAVAPPSCDGLTERETEVLRWVARGKSNGQIAALLFVSPHTVRKHLENVYEKLGVHSRTAAVARAFPASGQPLV